ncbi:MAG: alanine racemase [Desulfovibrionaceae bacterium]|nr:alanine racemase [Desulfovibrionaceae bacterium]
MFSGAVATVVRPENLRYNLRLLKARHPMLMPVIKADAYGHGVRMAARILREEGILHMAVGTIREAALLRADGHTAVLVSLMGLLEPDDAEIAIREKITPLVHNRETLEYFAEQSAALNLPATIALKFDTGMSRLGFPVEDASAIAERCRTLPGKIRPVLMLSHFAGADDAKLDEVTGLQRRRFHEAELAVKHIFPTIQTSLANSPGLLSWPNRFGDLVRPGLVLYGANPLYGTDRECLGEGLMPVMEVSAPVVSVHSLRQGESVSYGCLFRAPRDMRVAVVGIGYADGFPRSMSQTGSVLIQGKRAFILGRVCMQMCITDVTDIQNVAPGNRAFILGGEGSLRIRAEEMANWCGTIPYELFCSLGKNHRMEV